MKKIALFSATPFEIAPTRAFFEKNWAAESGVFQKNGVTVQPLVTGVGPISAAIFLSKFLAIEKVDWAIQAGVGGAFDPALALGSVVEISSERFGDLGAEDENGQLIDLFEMGLLGKNDWPFFGGVLKNPASDFRDFLPKKAGLTVSRAHGAENSIQKIREKFPDAEVESMEGAAFFQTCLLENQPFLELRAISNRVEKRNRAAWQMAEAIENLNAVLISMFEEMAA